MDLEQDATPPFDLKGMKSAPFAEEKHGFCLMWSKGKDPTICNWSMDARHTQGEVLGALTLNVPSVALSGHKVTMSVVDAVQQYMGVNIRGGM